MFICEKGSHCIGCNYEYADRIEDIGEEFRDCGRLIEVAPVKNAKWIKNKTSGLLVCSNCRKTRPYQISTLNPGIIEFYWDCEFCPNCGAKIESE